MSQYEYAPSVATPSATPQPRHKGKKKKRTPRALIYFSRKVVLKEFPRCFPWIKKDEDVTIKDITELFEKFKIYVCDVEFKKDCAFVYTRRTRGQILENSIWKLNKAIGWDRRKDLSPVARVLGNYGKFVKGKKDGKKVSVIRNIDRFGDPYALVFFKKEHFAKEAWKVANPFEDGLL